MDGLEARGVLFLGVMWTAQGPKLLEYNVRFGDPETQVLMQLLDEDLPALLLDVALGRLRPEPLRLRPGCALVVVAAAEGYPEGAVMGVPLSLEEPDLTVLHAGSRFQDGRWVTAGGRVLNLVTLAPDLAAARAKMEQELPRVHWPGMQVRRDIGLRALRHGWAGRGVEDPW